MLQSVPSKNERLNAMLAHAGVLLGFLSRGVLGILLAFAIWFTQREKSDFVARQALQALTYQLIGIVVVVLAWLIWGFVFLSSIFTPLLVSPQNPQALQPYFMIPAFALMVFPLSVMIGWLAYGLYAAAQVWRGTDFAYPVIGKWFRRIRTSISTAS